MYFVGLKVVEGQPKHTSARGLTGRRILLASSIFSDLGQLYRRRARLFMPVKEQR